jgi:hypothetical protein
MARRKYDSEKLIQAAAWDVHHALVAAVRRLVKLSGGVQEAKDVIDAIAADALEDEKEEAPERPTAPSGNSSIRAWRVRRTTCRPRPGGDAMTSRMTVLAKHPETLSRCVQPEAHAVEEYERRLNWEIYAGPAEEAVILGASLTEDSAWAAAELFEVTTEAG